MKVIAAVFLGFALAGCASDAQWSPLGSSLFGRSPEAVDDEKCRELGLAPQTEAYGNCRLILEQKRMNDRAAERRHLRSNPVIGSPEQEGKVYDSSECIGPVIMGRCQGTILPNKAYHPTCHGEWLNGQCTGPMF